MAVWVLYVSMEQNNATMDATQTESLSAVDNTDDPRNIIDTVVVVPDDVIEALRFNGRPPEYKNQVSAAIRISPSFESESGTSIVFTEEGNNYPPEMNPKPIHIIPGSSLARTSSTSPSAPMNALAPKTS